VHFTVIEATPNMIFDLSILVLEFRPRLGGENSLGCGVCGLSHPFPDGNLDFAGRGEVGTVFVPTTGGPPWQKFLQTFESVFGRPSFGSVSPGLLVRHARTVTHRSVARWVQLISMRARAVVGAARRICAGTLIGQDLGKAVYEGEWIVEIHQTLRRWPGTGGELHLILGVFGAACGQ
jgi:hypothetical protein